MNAIGWQVCGVLLGVSAIIIAVYLAKTLNSASKTIDNANALVTRATRIVDENEKDIIPYNTLKITIRNWPKGLPFAQKMSEVIPVKDAKSVI